MSLHIPDSEFNQKIRLNESKRLEILLSFAALPLQRGEERTQRMIKGQNSFNQISNLQQMFVFQDFKVRIHKFHMHTPWTL